MGEGNDAGGGGGSGGGRGERTSFLGAVPSAVAFVHSALIRSISAGISPSSPSMPPCAPRNAVASSARCAPSLHAAYSAASTHT